MAPLGKHPFQLLTLGFRQADGITRHGLNLQTRCKAIMENQSIRSVNSMRLAH
jgi:hypothetical protein